MRRVKYSEALCGILHDVGKVFLRYKQRYKEGLETALPDILAKIPDMVDHEKVGVEVVKEATHSQVDLSICKLFRQAIPYADVVAAAERGLSSYLRYLHLSRIWSRIEEEVSSKIKSPYNHVYAPLLSPLWIAYVTDYASAVGPCAEKPYSADTALTTFQRLILSVAEGLEVGDADKIASALAQILEKLIDKPLWIAPRPLTINGILELRTHSYSEAQKLADYSSISKCLFEGLKSISELYGPRVVRGYVDTVGELMRFTLLAVPAAVYMALLPDTSLYSHSKLVAAYTATLSTGGNKFRLLVVDARGIQNFVASPIVPKAASRVVRGRSFLVELLLASLVNYILELYGGLPYANVLTSEGGTVDIVVPALELKHEEIVLNVIRKAVKSTYERFRGLWFTIALSREFGIEDVDFVKNLKECKYEGVFAKCPGFFELEEDLAKRLATEKARDEAQSVLSVDEQDIEGFDAITKESVTRKDLTEWYGFRVIDIIKDYASAISGGKLEVGDLVCEPTHLSLVAGSALRNLAFLASIYVYKLEDCTLVPATEEVEEVLEALRDGIGQEFKLTVKPEYLFFGGIPRKGYLFDIALIPLPTLGAVHVMVSARTQVPIYEVRPAKEKPEEALHTIRRELEETSLELVSRLIEVVDKKLKELVERKCQVRVEVRAVNKGVEFVKILENKRLAEVAKRLLDFGADFHVGTIHTGTHHPATPEGLVDLDAYNLIAMVKADADGLGEVRKLLSFSPTRLSALSDYITTVVNCKTNILAAEVTAEHVYGLKPRGPIILYAGGDDVALYGYWVDAMILLNRFYRDVVNALFPLSFTSAVAIERSDYPLLELYSKVVRLLGSGKEDTKGWVYLADVSSTKPIICVEGSFKLTSGLQPSESGVYSIAPKPAKPYTLLELYESLATLIEKLEKSLKSKDKLAVYKRELMLLSRIAALSEPELSELVGALVGGKAGQNVSALYNLTRRLVAFSYVSARRREDFGEMAKLLGDLLGVAVNNVRLHHESGEDILEVMRRVLSSKTSIDLLVLYLNPYSTEIRVKSTS